MQIQIQSQIPIQIQMLFQIQNPDTDPDSDPDSCAELDWHRYLGISPPLHSRVGFHFGCSGLSGGAS